MFATGVRASIKRGQVEKPLAFLVYYTALENEILKVLKRMLEKIHGGPTITREFNTTSMKIGTLSDLKLT